MNESNQYAAPADRGGKEQENHTEPAAKRGLFAPIMFILLVLSLMGNVVLYTFHLQDGKDKREAAGAEIYGDVQAVSAALSASAEGLAALPDADIAGRYQWKTKLERELTLGGLSWTSLLQAADGTGREAMHADVRDHAAIFFARSSEALALIGAHEGPLTADELAFVEQLHAAYAELAGQASRIVLPGELTDLAAMQLAAGGSWVNIVYAMAERMAEIDSTLSK